MREKFRDAFRGIVLGLKDRSIRLQWILAGMALCAGILLRLSAGEWTAVILCMAAVLVSETLNTAVERLCDLYTASYNENIRYIKDLSASAVLLASLAALACALIILLRHTGGIG